VSLCHGTGGSRRETATFDTSRSERRRMDLARGMGRWVLWILGAVVLSGFALFPIEAALGEGLAADVLQVLVFHALLAVGVWWEWRRNRTRATE
jgi:Flp pilus assembly protein TadB